MTPDVLDLSHNDEPAYVDFHAFKAAGVKGVILKATQGVGFVDPTFEGYLQRAQEVGLLVGAYHFLDNTGQASDQFAHYQSVVKGLPLLHAADWEDLSNCGVEVLDNFIDGFHNATGLSDLLLYLPIGWREQVPQLSTEPYWCPDYAPTLSAEVGHWHLWQFTKNWNGQSIDASTWNSGHGDITAWWSEMAVCL